MRPGRFAVLMALCALMAGAASADDWTLGAMEFMYTQSVPRSSSERGAAATIPSLVLERLSSGAMHTPSSSELLQRSLYNLQTERLSLFMQLAREVKVRDSLVLSESDARALRKKIAAQEEKIHSLERQIDENLAETRRQRARQEPGAAAISARLASEPAAERIVLYKDDATVLYTPAGDSAAAGPESFAFSDAVVREHINGLLTGQIVSYGNYARVTVDIRTYPGGELSGSVTEVGTLGDCMDIAANIAASLLPKIMNALPVRLFFDILPASAQEQAEIIIDGVICEPGAKVVDIAAGTHTIDVSCGEQYFSKRITYDFRDSLNFMVHVPLEKKRDGTFAITLELPGSSPLSGGSHYADGSLIGRVSGSSQTDTVQINGKTIIGQFVAQDAAGRTVDAFYYVPEEQQRQGAELSARLRPRNTADDIDKRRVWAYRGYTALMLSLPLAFLTYGRYDSAGIGYRAGLVDAATVNNWAYAENAAVGVSVLAGGFFLVELARYLYTAGSVLPERTRVVQPGLPTESIILDAGD